MNQTMSKLILFRFNQFPTDIPINRIISIDASNNILKVTYYDDEENQISATGYHILHKWHA